MSTISTRLDNVTMLKLTRRAARVGMTPGEAFREIATKGPEFFLARLVGATNATRRRAGKGAV